MSIAALLAVVGLMNKQVSHNVAIENLQTAENGSYELPGNLIANGESYYISNGNVSIPISVNNKSLEGGTGFVKLLKQGSNIQLLSFNKTPSTSDFAKVEDVRIKNGGLFLQLNGEYVQFSK